MSRQQFLGSIDLGITTSLLTNTTIPILIDENIQINTIKHDENLILIELGHLLTPDECEQIVNNIRQQTFENMHEKYDIRKRNNSRLIVMDEQLAKLLWQRIEVNKKLTELVTNMKPLGFNVHGKWQMSRVNPAMRLNKYDENEYFAPHKDAQYAPSGDERSLLSLLIYLTDNYDEGETKFYFPKTQLSVIDMKGLTIKEEIQAYGGLQNGYECIALKPKKGYAILFTHNLLHEAISPKKTSDSKMMQRFVLRSDLLVERIEKPSGFAVCPEEEEDYFACLDLFREAQQNELNDVRLFNSFQELHSTGDLYERSLSIRYCYPRLLEYKLSQSNLEQHSIIHQLPSELWLHIFQFMNEQDIQYLTFADPEFQLLKLIWDAQTKQSIEHDSFRSKFFPTIHTQYGSRTLFRFSDANFFFQHVHECCRVAAVYAFFLLGHSRDATTYIVRYDRNTQEVCEVEMNKLLTDVFYNRNCYGSLYRIKQKDENKRQSTIDFNASVDRTYMSNRHESQFIGEDLLSHCYLRYENPNRKSEKKFDNIYDENKILAFQRNNALFDSNERLVDRYVNLYENPNCRMRCSRNGCLGFREYLLNQIEKQSSTNLFRMLLSQDHVIDNFCNCSLSHNRFENVRDLIQIYNHLIFDFDTHQLKVEQLTNQSSNTSYQSVLHKSITILQTLVPQDNPISFYRTNIEKLATKTRGFNHASCQCSYPSVKVNQFSFLDYTHLSHVYLTVTRNDNDVFVLATYDGIAAL
ncbi:hypothetical protein I4U23_025088 [Adineta vaga]|nr:hypothetical protein I4U23_025088 [Adineta vaga]